MGSPILEALGETSCGLEADELWAELTKGIAEARNVFEEFHSD